MNKALLYNTENYIQYHGITIMGKKVRKTIYVHKITLLKRKKKDEASEVSVFFHMVATSHMWLFKSK